MINVSAAFREALDNGNRKYIKTCKVTLADGTSLSLDDSQMCGWGFRTEDSVSNADQFEVGAAIVNKLTLTLNNYYDEFTGYDFDGAEAIPSVGLALADGTEKVQKGVFHVNEASYDGSVVTLSCYDNMAKFDKGYSASKLEYPASLNAIVRDACSCCGVSLGTTSFPHDGYVVSERPDDSALTFRNAIQWAAQIAGCFARCNYQGLLELKWYYDIN